MTVTTGSNPTTVFLGGLWVEVVGSSQRGLYLFNGQLMVSATVATNAVTYYHSDHLGSIVTAGNGTSVGTQDYTPWGEERNPGGMSQTSYNYTGQRKDATGLLYYHARQYNPMTGKFGSPDSIVPGAASASGGGAATLGGGSTTPLTVDFHEPGFAAQLNRHNATTGSMGFWFELSSDERRKAESPMGPANPQALNRFSYTLNNPLRYTDPSGHKVCSECGGGGLGGDPCPECGSTGSVLQWLSGLIGAGAVVASELLDQAQEIADNLVTAIDEHVLARHWDLLGISYAGNMSDPENPNVIAALDRVNDISMNADHIWAGTFKGMRVIEYIQGEVGVVRDAETGQVVTVLQRNADGLAKLQRFVNNGTAQWLK